MLQQWQAVGNIMSDLTSPRFEPQTSPYGDERVTARTTCQSCFMNLSQLFYFNVNLINLINTPSIFYCANFAFGKTEGSITQKFSLLLSIYYINLFPICKVNIANNCL